ncbi:MAG: EFR1 family ferrodoxin, partial [Spirochaetaceae bacterium]|nr:EFR1 family ferrodoxin [Spirochaetaceae bacterium]
MDNIVFYFSGTGNSFKVAKTISNELENCAIVSMAKPFSFTKQYDSIGFVYPVYFWGLPRIVIEFIKNINLKNNKNAYYYSVATYGGIAGNAVYQIYELLLNIHAIKLNYSQKLHMFANYVAAYDMSNKTEAITKKSNKKLIPIINAIKTKKNNKVSTLTKIFESMNKKFVETVLDMDKDFSVNTNCTGCGLCKKMCPVHNIEMLNNKPQYKHHCEQCMACIQFCPQKAINYKNLTQNRRRYTNPEINRDELAE